MKKGYCKNDVWKTPSHIYEALDAEFGFDFDPCPLTNEEITQENDGLIIPWGKSNFVNPPYSRGIKDKFIKKAIEEYKKGNLSVLLLPVSTSTRIFHDCIMRYASEIRFVDKRIRFEGVNTKGELVSSSTGMHDSMIVVLNPDKKVENGLPSISSFCQKGRE